ncbi:hypothetical protein ACFOED_10140 [Vulcaniibacterium thermophilum]|jgi:hypothetical protein|uniref:hypothetical protein n=1 Tax=Vulcaniibacterium thermophilum TaxID=1169913 RepID=UPI0011B4C72F|nr:hypothetical protein [Vulcaniibacterium thermophilum]
MASITYAAMAMGLGAPFFTQGEERLDMLWQIYMSPMFDQEPVMPLAFSAVASLGLCLLYFSKYFSTFSSRPSTGRASAVLSFVLLFNALINFGHLVVYGFLAAFIFTLWAWWRSDPEDSWL